ncbi:MAG: helix-turn-helix domain-containing protein [Myxococcales bacterium FL481]|nr:MAG: helix-turn-helix domain-containing protein [Myxococcales bacterium FL481]
MARLDLRRSFFGGPGFTMFHAWGSNASVPMDPHFHDEYVISVQIVGDEQITVSGKTEHLSAGDSALLNPYQVHTGNDRGTPNLEYISLYVDRQVVQRVAAEIDPGVEAPEFTVTKIRDQQVVAAGLFEILDLVRQQAATARVAPVPTELAVGDKPSDETSYDLSIECALHRVVHHTFEHYSNLRHPMWRSTNRIAHRRIARAVDFIRTLDRDENTRETNLDELAKIAGLSKYHFLRQFSQVVGMTPGAYLRTLRVCRAAEKLRAHTMPIVDIAMSVGFADHPSFSRAFARQMGMTPSEYQRAAAN